MKNEPFTLASFPRAILHIDGDAFFASCEQSRNPKLKDKPVITGKERGIAASMSYEAKARGVTRGMRISDIKKVCPEAILLPSDYETYSILSKRFFNIVRRYTPDVEEYSIDECFADVTGLRRPMHMSYENMAKKIKHDLDSELGFTFSVGLAPNKVIGKVGSKWKKPSGLTVIPAYKIHLYLEKLTTDKIWGIGINTAALLAKYRLYTALDFARADEKWVRAHLTKPHYEIWQELNGRFIYELSTEEKHVYQSIQKMKTFTPPSKERGFIFAQLSKNIENACIKMRRYNLASKKALVFIRTQQFKDVGVEIELSQRTAFPSAFISAADKAFDEMYRHNVLYRTTGIVMFNLEEENNNQMDLFGTHVAIASIQRVYKSVDAMRLKYGKHSVFLGTSFLANKFSQHAGERGETPHRRQQLLKGETKRKRLAIPMLM